MQELTLIEWLIRLFAPPPADTSRLHKALTGLQGLLPQRNSMTSPTGNVQIPQADLDKFATDFEAVKTALSTYIDTLKANQATPLPAADEAGLQQALADLTSLQPPAPTP